MAKINLTVENRFLKINITEDLSSIDAQDRYIPAFFVRMKVFGDELGIFETETQIARQPFSEYTLEGQSFGSIDDLVDGLTAAIEIEINSAELRNYFIELSRGSITGRTQFSTAGVNNNISTGSEDLWTNGGLYTFPSSAEQLDVTSSSALDNSSGTGARSIIIRGLDSNYDQIEETVITNGTTKSTSIASFLRVNEAFVVTSGALASNVGDITIENQSADVMAHIAATKGIAQQLVYTVPNNKTALLLGITVSSTRELTLAFNPVLKFEGRARYFGGSWLTLFPIDLDVSSQSVATIKQETYVPLPGRTDLVMRCTTDRNQTLATAVVWFEIMDDL